MIDVSGVSALQGHTTDQNLIVAANNTLTNFSEILKTISVNANFKYLLKIYEHITSFVAHIPVRNVSIRMHLLVGLTYDLKKKETVLIYLDQTSFRWDQLQEI